MPESIVDTRLGREQNNFREMEFPREGSIFLYERDIEHVFVSPKNELVLQDELLSLIYEPPVLKPSLIEELVDVVPIPPTTPFWNKTFFTVFNERRYKLSEHKISQK